MDQTEAGSPSQQKYLTLRQAAFIGVGAMVAVSFGSYSWASASSPSRPRTSASHHASCPRRCISRWDRDRRLHRHRAGRVRHAQGGEGDLLGEYRGAGVRQCGLLADERHRVVRHRWGDHAVAIVAAGGVLLTFVFTTLLHEPASMVTLGAILVLSIALDFGWKRARAGRADHLQAVN